MQNIHITDCFDDRLSDYSKLSDVALRRVLEPAGGLYIAESNKVISRALQAGHQPRSVLVHQKWLPELEPLLSKFPNLPVFIGESDVLEQLTGYHLHRGALAAMHRPQLPDINQILSTAKRIVILEDIVDHTNVGAIFRSVAGLGADAVLITPRCADPLYRRSVRVSMGTVLQIPWTRTPEWQNLQTILKNHNFEIAALALNDNAVPLAEYVANAPEKVALVLGSEGDGLSRAALTGADKIVTIEMLHGVDSLNVASASAVALWALQAGSQHK